jgi:hypothetical protein
VHLRQAHQIDESAGSQRRQSAVDTFSYSLQPSSGESSVARISWSKRRDGSMPAEHTRCDEGDHRHADEGTKQASAKPANQPDGAPGQQCWSGAADEDHCCGQHPPHRRQPGRRAGSLGRSWTPHNLTLRPAALSASAYDAHPAQHDIVATSLWKL